MMNGDTKQETEEMPTAPFTVLLKNGRQVLLTDLNEKELRKQGFKVMRSLKNTMLRMLSIKDEMNRRDLEIKPMTEDPLTLVQHCLILAMNMHNQRYPKVHIVHTSPPKCPECFGMGGLYVPILGIDDDCPTCEGTGDAQ